MRTTQQQQAQAKKRGRPSKADREAMAQEIKDEQQALNAENIGKAMGEIAALWTTNLNLSTMGIKLVIGFMYGYTLGVVYNAAMAAIMLLSMPAWINFVIGVLLAMATLYAIWVTVTPVTNVVYNAGDKAVSFLRREYHSLRKWFAEFNKDDTQVIVPVVTH